MQRPLTKWCSLGRKGVGTLIEDEDKAGTELNRHMGDEGDNRERHQDGCIDEWLGVLVQIYRLLFDDGILPKASLEVF